MLSDLIAAYHPRQTAAVSTGDKARYCCHPKMLETISGNNQGQNHAEYDENTHHQQKLLGKGAFAIVDPVFL